MSDKKKVEVNADIVLRIGSRQMILSVEEAKTLKFMLDGIFGYAIIPTYTTYTYTGDF